MSYFDDASLVFIPSGTKTSKAYSVKPIDGTGDLTFTRSNDTATRVNSAGLIEKVRTNLNPNGNLVGLALNTSPTGYTDFNTGTFEPVTNTTSSVGTFCKFTTSSTRSFLVRSFTGITSGIGYSFSFKVQSVTGSVPLDNVSLVTSGGTNLVYYVDGVPKASGTAITQGTVYVQFQATASTVEIRIGSGVAVAATAVLEIGNFQLETGDIATNYIATTSAAVSVGPVANVPRLDYLNSSCPRLLLEPQRTNVALYSEQFNGSSWTKSGSGVGIAPVVTANNGISPDGYQNADRIDLNLNGGTSSSDWSWVYQSFSATGTQPQAFSIYLKAATAGDVGKVIRVGFISYVTHTLTADWTRVVLNQTFGTTSTFYIGFRLRGTEATANTASLYAWGAQLEQNAAYSSSYIPTLVAAVTRGADAFSLTSLQTNGIIGSTGLSFFLNFRKRNLASLAAKPALTSAGELDVIGISTTATTLVSSVRIGGASFTNTTILSPYNNQMVKVCFTLSGTTLKVFVNGSLSLTTTASSSSVFTQLTTTTALDKDQEYEQILLFPTPLSDADAIALTA